jgi:hypothetical protein
MALFTQAPRKVRASRAWARQTARVAFPVTIIKPNGETFTVAPTRKQVAKRKSNAKHTPKRVAKLPATITAQDNRAITLEERRQAFIESQRKIEREMLGAYN